MVSEDQRLKGNVVIHRRALRSGGRAAPGHSRTARSRRGSARRSVIGGRRCLPGGRLTRRGRAGVVRRPTLDDILRKISSGLINFDGDRANDRDTVQVVRVLKMPG